MSVASTRAVMMRYFNSDLQDSSMLAADVTFTMMPTGQEWVGPEAVKEMLNETYRVAFDAIAESTNMIFADNQAVWEGFFIGKHIGEFAGIPATGKDVRVPLCVVYDIVSDQIKRARIYFEIPVIME